jgi:hypothetical protein
VWDLVYTVTPVLPLLVFVCTTGVSSARDAVNLAYLQIEFILSRRTIGAKGGRKVPQLQRESIVCMCAIPDSDKHIKDVDVFAPLENTF